MATLAQVKEAIARSGAAAATKPAVSLQQVKSAIAEQMVSPTLQIAPQDTRSGAPVDTDIPQLDPSGDILPSGGIPFTEGRDVEQDFRTNIIPPETQLQLKGMWFGVEALLHGGEELARATISVVPGIDIITDYKQTRKNRNKVIDKWASNLSDRDQKVLATGKFTGQFGPLFLVNPATAVGRIAAGGATSLALPTEGENPHLFTQERTMNLIIGTGGAGAVDGIFKAGRALIGKSVESVRGVTSFFTRKGGERAAVAGVEPTSVERTLKTTGRLGVKPLTPAEATQNPAILARERAAISGLSGERQLQVSQTQQVREAEISDVIVNSINRIVPEGDVAAAKQLQEFYTPAFQTKVPVGLLNKITSSPLYEKAFKSMQTSPSVMKEYHALPDGSLGQVELVRREISRMANSLGKSIESTSRNEARGWQELNGEVKRALTGLSDDYRKALPLAQRMIVKKRILADLDELATVAKPDGVSVYNATPGQFFKAILGTTAKRKELARQLKNVIGAEKRMDDLAFILARMEKGPMKAITGESDRFVQGGTLGQGSLGIAVSNAMAFMRGRHNLAMVELITNGKWANALAKTRKIKDPQEQLEALTVVLTTVMADNIDEMQKEATKPILLGQ